jgi:hypothetical protein
VHVCFLLQFAPVKGSAGAAFTPAPVFTAPVAASVAAPSTPVAASSGPIATTTDLSVAAFVGVPDAAHTAGLRSFYGEHAPEKLAQVSMAAFYGEACCFAYSDSTPCVSQEHRVSRSTKGLGSEGQEGRDVLLSSSVCMRV